MARILYFGRLAELAGHGEADLPLPADATVDTLCDLIGRGDAALADALRSPSVRVAVDRVIVNGDAAIGEADELAFLPPVSGG